MLVMILRVFDEVEDEKSCYDEYLGTIGHPFDVNNEITRFIEKTFPNYKSWEITFNNKNETSAIIEVPVDCRYRIAVSWYEINESHPFAYVANM